MSKKRKGPSVPVSTRPPVVSAAPSPASARPVAPAPPKPPLLPEAQRPFVLIRFDRRVKWFIGICVGLFVLLTLAKINYSSVGMWNTVIPDGSDIKRGIVSGTPKSIRIDEWGVVTPFMMSQANQGFPLENPAIGGDKVALVGYYPIKHFVSIFRPSHWGFFMLPLDIAFAWHWNFSLVFGFLATALLFLALTRNNFWLSVLGAFWLVFSPGFAWWSFFLMTIQFSACVLLLSSLYVFYARSVRTIIIGGLCFLWSLASFALILYPPYQVMMGYLMLFLLFGFVWQYYRPERLLDRVWLKVGMFALALAVFGVIIYAFFQDAKSSIEVMTNTVYPGKRTETGGTGFVANWFSEYYSGWLVTNERFPKNWLNVCELSHFVTFTPVIALGLGVSFFYTRKAAPMLLCLLGFILFTLFYIEIGFPVFLAKATLFDVSPTRRAQVPFGIANVVLTVLYLNFLHNQLQLRLSTLASALLIAGAVGIMLFAAWLNLSDSAGFFKVHQLFLPTAFFMVINYLMLPVTNFRYKDVVIASGLVLFTLPNVKINPVAKGLVPITEHVLYQKVRELHLQEPAARWVVLGSQYITYLVTATGVNQLSGVKNQPDFKTMRVLDPTARRDSAYNRYAHSIYSTYIDPTHPDTVVIQNGFEDGYQVGLDPCSPKLKTLNVRYFIFDHVPQPVEVRCMKQVAKLGNLEIYRSND